MKKVAVTGAGGFIGAYLAKRLVLEGCDVVAIDNFIRGAVSRLDSIKQDISIQELDVRDKDALVPTLKGCDTVFHLAAVNGTDNFYNHPDLVLDVGIKGMFAVAEACIEADVGSLVVASTAEVYQTPSIIPTPENIPLILPNSTNPRYSYGGSKIASELIALNVGRSYFEKVQIFRPHNVYGPDMGWKHVIPQFIEKIKSQMSNGNDKVVLPIQGNGQETRAFCYVDDIVDGLIIMERLGGNREIYHIGNDFEISILDLISELENCLDVSINVEMGPAADGGTARRCPDISKMKMLGYSPKIDLGKGLSKTVNWYLEHDNIFVSGLR